MNQVNYSVFFLMMIIFVISDMGYSQKKEYKISKSSEYHEVKEDEYLPVSRENQARSPAYRYTMDKIVTNQVNVDSNGLNIIGDAANEPSIAIDRNDTKNMAIGWRQFNSIHNNFRQAGYGFSTNGGETWTFPGVIEPGVFRSDPVLDSDIDGNFYYNSLTNDPTFLCHVFKSRNRGSSWGSGTYALGGDKQWMEIDKTNGPGSGNSYAFWTSYYSICSPGSFTRSTNNGVSFEDCITIPNDPYWGTIAINSEGQLYIGGSTGDNFLVVKSSNAKYAGQAVNWEMAKVVSLDGFINFGEGPNPGGLLGQTIIAVDTSHGLYHGNVYLLCSVTRYSNSDPLDVMFIRSTDGGVSWSQPKKINDDNDSTAYQWFGTMSVAPNGRIDAIWLDTRDNPGTYLSALYYSYSKDGGLTWSANEKLSAFFNPHLGWPNQNKMGDYFDMVSFSNGASLAWAATFNGEQDVYYSYITNSDNVPVELQSFTAFSNGQEVILNWSTATELNNMQFEIQRSFEGNEFSTIGIIYGKGTQNERQDYSYSDKILRDGKYSYRLKQVDYQGTYSFSEIIELDLRAFQSYLLEQNYPNPFNPSTKIGYGIREKGQVNITILNAIGEEIALLVNEEKEPGYHLVEFNASAFPSGVYFYQIKVGKFTEVKKMVVIK